MAIISRTFRCDCCGKEVTNGEETYPNRWQAHVINGDTVDYCSVACFTKCGQPWYEYREKLQEWRVRWHLDGNASDEDDPMPQMPDQYRKEVGDAS